MLSLTTFLLLKKSATRMLMFPKLTTLNSSKKYWTLLLTNHRNLNMDGVNRLNQSLYISKSVATFNKFWKERENPCSTWDALIARRKFKKIRLVTNANNV